MYNRFDIGKAASDLTAGTQFDAYTGVIINVGTDDEGNNITYEVGDDSGRVLTIENEWGTWEMARAILSGLSHRGFRYQPYTATDALLDPAAELGDGITVNGVDGDICALSVFCDSLTPMDVSAPADEEIDDEITYEPRTVREFKREKAYSRARLTINQNAITAEVSRATEAEGELSANLSVTAEEIRAEVTAETTRATGAERALSSSLAVTAEEIRAEVTEKVAGESDRAGKAEEELSSRITANARGISLEATRATEEEGKLSGRIDVNADAIEAKVSKSGGSASSFGWRLEDSSWSVFSGGSTVLKATSSGLEISGKITASSGEIAGFTIESTNIHKGVTSLSDTSHTGVYLGTDGIVLGKGKFKVDSSGNLTASSGTFSGNVYANKIQVGDTEGHITGSQVGSGTLTTGNLNTWLNTATSGGYFANDVFNGIQVCNYMKSRRVESEALIHQGYRALWNDITIDGTAYRLLTGVVAT